MKFHFHAAKTDKARLAFDRLHAVHGQSPWTECDVMVVLGGDGTMLEALHLNSDGSKPVFGMNFGSVGFLMNPFREDDLVERIKKASRVDIHPLKMRATDKDGKVHEAIAFNEVALLRETRQTAHLKISVDDKERIPELVCDGILLATPAGSTAYNLSAHGPILPSAPAVGAAHSSRANTKSASMCSIPSNVPSAERPIAPNSAMSPASILNNRLRSHAHCSSMPIITLKSGS
jgi:NAD+ kinase